MTEISKKSILLVDDNEDVREVLKMTLTRAGFTVDTAEHGFSALSRLTTSVPDLVISDLYMPEMSGFEFLSIVRSCFPEVSVIASSGAFTGEDVPAGVMADAFHPKGANIDLLLGMIDSLIRTAPRRVSHPAEQSTRQR